MTFPSGVLIFPTISPSNVPCAAAGLASIATTNGTIAILFMRPP
jgi:hypothetical protein